MDYVMIGALICVIVLILHQIRIDTLTRQELFKVQIEMAQGQQAMTKELPWAELKKLIDEIILYTCINYITVNGIRNMDDNQITLIWTAMLNDISASVELSISDEIRRQILKNITISYLTKYIKDSVQIVLVNDLETNRNNRVNKKIERYRTGKVMNNTVVTKPKKQ